MFKQGDYITNNRGEEGYFVASIGGNDVIERIDGKGWERKYNPGLIPENYIPKGKGLYWAISIGQFKLTKPAELSYEIY